MPDLLGPALVAAGLLALAGAQKLLDPTMAVGALRAMRLPSAPGLVRLGAAAELAVGVAAVVVGGVVSWLLVAASYVGFAAFVRVALSRGLPIASCGCFGRADMPPRPLHVVVNGILAAVAAGAAATFDRAPLDELADHPWRAVVVLGAAAAAGAMVYALFTRAPDRALRRP